MTDLKRPFTSVEQYALIEENERLKTELAEVKRFLQEINYSGELKGVWKQRIERFVK